jgi:hypothetical protein
MITFEKIYFKQLAVPSIAQNWKLKTDGTIQAPGFVLTTDLCPHMYINININKTQVADVQTSGDKSSDTCRQMQTYLVWHQKITFTNYKSVSNNKAIALDWFTKDP